MKLITDNAALAKAIKSIATRGQKLDRDIHEVGVSCLKQLKALEQQLTTASETL